MNTRRIEGMIPIAMNLIDSNEAGFFIDHEIDSRYKGYIDSYGPTIRQTGLLSAIAFYMKDDRQKINRLLLKILKRSKIIDEAEGNDFYKTMEGKIKDVASTERNRWKSIILDAVVASKLAIKTFRIKKRSEGNDS